MHWAKGWLRNTPPRKSSAVLPFLRPCPAGANHGSGPVSLATAQCGLRMRCKGASGVAPKYAVVFLDMGRYIR